LSLAFALLAFCSAAKADDPVARKLEEFMKTERAQRSKDKAAFLELTMQCIEKKVGSAALEALEVLEVLDPRNPRWEELRERAKGLPAPSSSFRSWGRGQLKRKKKEASKRWTDLWKEAEKREFRHATARVLEALLVFDPKNKKAHKALGHVKVKREWLSAFEQKMAKRGLHYDSKWGYVTDEGRLQLEAGQRPVGGKWIPRKEDETFARPWNQKLIFRDPRFVLESNFPFDTSLACHLALRAFLLELDGTFGDVLRPPDRVWPLTLKISRGKEGLMKAIGGDPELEQYAEHLSCFPNERGDVLYCRADGFPKKMPEAYRGTDFLRVRLLEWYYTVSVGGETPDLRTPNSWITWGVEALARSRGMFERGKLPLFGIFKDYLKGKGRNALPSVKELCNVPEG
jgi:hypothetical protein